MSANVRVIGADKVVATAALAKALQATTGPARVFQIHVTNTGGSAAWVQLFDAASAAAENAVPLISKKCANAADLSIDLGDGFPCTAGVYICGSSTQGAKTLIANSEVLITALVRLMS